jgi:hypothetical protein
MIEYMFYHWCWIAAKVEKLSAAAVATSTVRFGGLLMNSIDSEQFSRALLALLDETFDSVRGYYLDRGTSLFETLEEVSAAEASVPVGGKCATLAAQVKHAAFYLDVTEKGMREGESPQVDWGEIWRTVNTVTADEWEALKLELRASYDRILKLVEDKQSWPGETEIAEAIAIVAHTAYHLGEIRQALCTLKP